MSGALSDFQSSRSQFKPVLPSSLKGNSSLQEVSDAAPEVPSEIQELFPNTSNVKTVKLVPGDKPVNSKPLTVGVVLSGGPAPGGHNAIAGLYDAIKRMSPESKLIGFLNGPKGVIEGNHIVLEDKIIDNHRNTGGFDIIGSGRDKIETSDDINRCVQSFKKLGVTALVVIGGDDSNTNAAILAEELKKRNEAVQIIGLPKTIDGDMRNDIIETSFGFDTAAKTYANLVANIARDARSAGKYTHIIKLMGRAASHVALEVALQVQPNLTIISEEAEAKNLTLNDVVEEIVDVVTRRAKSGKNYGVIVIPEGLLEFLSDFKELLKNLSHLMRDEEELLHSLRSDEDVRQFITSKLPSDSAKVFGTLPDGIQHALLKPDHHGNIPVSHIETDVLLMDLVKLRLNELSLLRKFKGTFSPVTHFFGYEGRCVAPSNFDANYCYAIGYTAAQLIAAGLTGYTVYGQNLLAPSEDWIMGGVPVTSMLNLELRKGKMKPVIKKALVELDSKPFKAFAEARAEWIENDSYRFVGPIQYFGPPEIADSRTMTLTYERG